MLSLPGTIRILVCRKVVDFRKAHDGLCAVVRDEFGEDPLSGAVFVFFNGARDRVKLLVWDGNGFWLFYKRLERGTFRFEVRGTGPRMEIRRAELLMILEGIDQRTAKIASHFSTPLGIQSRGGQRGVFDRTSP